MGMSSPEPPKPPAKRPERKESISPEDIVVSDSDQASETKRGRRALRRPSGGSTGSTNGIGTGLST